MVGRGINPVSGTTAVANGKFFHRGRERNPPAYTLDPEVGRRLWEVSADLTNLAQP
jgi:hypothetical protein